NAFFCRIGNSFKKKRPKHSREASGPCSARHSRPTLEQEQVATGTLSSRCTARPPYAIGSAKSAISRKRRKDMGKKLAGKIALIAGGWRGIGAAIAQPLAADGANVAITYTKGA